MPADPEVIQPLFLQLIEAPRPPRHVFPPGMAGAVNAEFDL